MPRLPSCLATVGACLTIAGALHAQARPAGNVGLDKRIYTKIYIDVGDAAAPPYPIHDVHVLLVPEGSDTLRLTTDGAGATRAFLPRGQYRLITQEWVVAGGRGYKWNMPVTIGAGMHDIVLTEGNAAPAAQPSVAERPGTMTPLAGGEPRRTVAGESNAPLVIEGRRVLVDSTGMRWEVFEQDFSHAAVAGTDLPFPSVTVALMFENGDELRQLDHFPANWRTLPDRALIPWLSKARRIRP